MFIFKGMKHLQEKRRPLKTGAKGSNTVLILLADGLQLTQRRQGRLDGLGQPAMPFEGTDKALTAGKRATEFLLHAGGFVDEVIEAVAFALSAVLVNVLLLGFRCLELAIGWWCDVAVAVGLAI